MFRTLDTMPLLCDVCPKDMKLVCSSCNFARYCSHECLERDIGEHVGVCESQSNNTVINVGAKQKKKVQKTSEWILEKGDEDDFTVYTDSLRHMLTESIYKNGERTNATTVSAHTYYDHVKDLAGVYNMCIYIMLLKLRGQGLNERERDIKYLLRLYIENLHIIKGERFEGPLLGKYKYIKNLTDFIYDIFRETLLKQHMYRPQDVMPNLVLDLDAARKKLEDFDKRDLKFTTKDLLKRIEKLFVILDFFFPRDEKTVGVVQFMKIMQGGLQKMIVVGLAPS